MIVCTRLLEDASVMIVCTRLLEDTSVKDSIHKIARGY